MFGNKLYQRKMSCKFFWGGFLFTISILENDDDSSPARRKIYELHILLKKKKTNQPAKYVVGHRSSLRSATFYTMKYHSEFWNHSDQDGILVLKTKLAKLRWFLACCFPLKFPWQFTVPNIFDLLSLALHFQFWLLCHYLQHMIAYDMGFIKVHVKTNIFVLLFGEKKMML